MPNNVQCRLTASKHVLDSLASEKKPVDFNTVISMPPELNIEVRCDVKNAAARALLDFPDPNQGGMNGVTSRLELSNMARVPSPLTFDDATWRDFIVTIENKRRHGCYTWYDWSLAHWGTKWNAYDVERKSDTVLEFQTAWSCPLLVITALSAAHPNEVIRLDYADEDYGRNYGSIVFVGGRQDRRTDRIEIVQDLWDLSEDDMHEYHLKPALLDDPMTNRPDFRESVYEAIDAERERQDLKWGREPGRWRDPSFMKSSVLVEEVGEVAMAINDGKPEQMRAELVQVAAVAVCWLETIERLERDNRRRMPECSKDHPCCSRRDEYNGFGSGPELFTCPKSCACHD